MAAWAERIDFYCREGANARCLLRFRFFEQSICCFDFEATAVQARIIKARRNGAALELLP
jgi:hypothetical protein